MNKREIFQLSYIVTFMFSLINIAGSIELNIPINKGMLIVTLISGFLTIGKYVYFFIKGE